MSETLIYDRNGIKQYMYEEGNKIFLRNVIDEGPTLQALFEERKDNDTNGYTPGRSLRKIGGIPAYKFRQEPLLREYMMAKHDDPVYASRCIRLWMKINQFNSVDKVVI